MVFYVFFENNNLGIESEQSGVAVFHTGLLFSYSARLHTVDGRANPGYYRLLNAFYRKTGCPVLINTSFNVRGEPIVNTPEDSYRCFMRTGMDYLVMGNCLIDKTEQSEYEEDGKWKDEFVLD
ncbi:MAG: hypothetical protein OEY64_01530 [Nitrospinota bacterium]|nr:hypothetical protein [Nitrospinota bacterium]